MKLKLKWTPETINRGTDRIMGAALYQITSASLISYNIYCEERYTSTDGRYIAFLRSALGQEGLSAHTLSCIHCFAGGSLLGR